MTICDFSTVRKDPILEPRAVHFTEELPTEFPSKMPLKGKVLSSFLSRLLFALLLGADLIWGCYALCLFILANLGALLSLGRLPFFKILRLKCWVSMKRSLVCGLSLFTALFSPAFGIMIACTYFLMYDKKGIEQIVPASLQEQFREFFPALKA